MDRFSPHGHPVAVHLNVDSNFTLTNGLANALKHLHLIGANYLYIRPVDSSGQKVDATQPMKDAIGQATTALGL